MGALASQITPNLTIVTQPLIQTQITENINAPRHLPVTWKVFPLDDVIMCDKNDVNMIFWLTS